MSETMREVRRMVGASAAVVLLLGAVTGVYLEKVRRDTATERAAVALEYEALQQRMLSAKAAFSRLETDNALLTDQNIRLRASVEEALKEASLSLDRMKGLSAQLAVAGAIAKKNFETLRDAPSSEEEVEEGDAEEAAEDDGVLDPRDEEVAALRRQLDLTRQAAMYFAKYAELLTAGRKVDAAQQKAMLESALNALGVTQQQYDSLGRQQ